MYEAVHARPDGASTVARMAHAADEYGYAGVVVRNHGDARAGYDAERIAAACGVDVVEGIEIRADGPEQAGGYVGSYRPQVTVLAVHGGTPAMNRFAVENDRVDVLAHPMAGDGDVNHVLAKAAVEHGVRLEVNLRRVLDSHGGRRVKHLRALRKLRELIEAYDAPYVVSADPASHLAYRAPRELAAVGEAIGFSAAAIREGLREWKRLVERNREITSERFVEPGVQIGRYRDEGDDGTGDGDRTTGGETDPDGPEEDGDRSREDDGPPYDRA